MKIEEYIHKFRTEHGVHFFLYGGCYIFARILQVNYGGVIYSNIDHCRLRIGPDMYDITGHHNYNNDYIPIDDLSEVRYRTFKTFIR